MNVACWLWIAAASLMMGSYAHSSHKELDATLVSGFATPAINGILPYLSPKGDKAYLYFVNIDSTSKGTQPVAQLYDIINGELVNPITIPMPSVKNPFAWYGWASQDFTRFSSLESNCVKISTCTDMIVRVFDANLDVVASRTFSDVNFAYVMGGSFSEDNHYLIFAYSVPAPAPSVSYESFVYILDATDPSLPTVAGPITISAFDPYTTGPTLFTLTDHCRNKNLYFSFVSMQFDFIASTFTTPPPYFSQVYGVDVENGTITLVDQVPLPKFAENNVFVRKKRNEALICHGGQCSVNPAEPSIYTVIDETMIGDLPPDYNAVRILSFDGKKLKTILKQQINCCSDLLAYPPSDGYLFFLAQSIEVFKTPGDPTSLGPNFQEFWSLFDINKGPKGLVLRPQNGPFSDVSIPADTAFSQNGKWMLLDFTMDIQMSISLGLKTFYSLELLQQSINA